MLIADLDQYLARQLGQADSDIGSLTAALNTIGQPAMLSSLLGELSSSRVLVDEIAEGSHWHPNGFGKIALITRPRYKLRLNVWHEPSDPAWDVREDIHSHRRDFATVLLAGSYRHQEFQVSDEGAEFYAYAYQTAQDYSSYSLSPVGVRRLRCVFDARLSQGSTYSIASELVHRVIPDPVSPPVSLVLDGPLKPSGAEVFTLDAISQAVTAPTARLPTDYLVSSLRAAMSLIPPADRMKAASFPEIDGLR